MIWTVAIRLAAIGAAAAALCACASAPPPAPTRSAGQEGLHGTMAPYYVRGRWYKPSDDTGYDKKGLASWYGPESGGRRTANGEPFDPDGLSAAHTTLPLPCLVEVTNLDNGRRATLRVNDRGPFSGDRILDVSRGAARELGFYAQGTAHVRVRYLGPAPRLAGDATVRTAAVTSRRRPSNSFRSYGPASEMTAVATQAEPLAGATQAIASADLF